MRDLNTPSTVQDPSVSKYPGCQLWEEKDIRELEDPSDGGGKGVWAGGQGLPMMWVGLSCR